MKAVADGERNIMLRLDIMEGKERQAQKPLPILVLKGQPSLYGFVAVFCSGRVIHADSAFSSVRTCLKLREHGLHFMGV